MSSQPKFLMIGRTISVPFSSFQPLHQILDLDNFGQGNDDLGIHLNNCIYVDFLLVCATIRQRRVGTIGLGLEPQSLQDLLLHDGIGDSGIDSLPIPIFDESHESFCFLSKLALGDKLAKMDSSTEGLQARHVASSRASVIFFGCPSISPPKVSTSLGEDLTDVFLFDNGIHVYIVRMKDVGVFDRLHHGSLQDLWEEWIFVRSIVSTDKRVQAFSLGQHKIDQGYRGRKSKIA